MTSPTQTGNIIVVKLDILLGRVDSLEKRLCVVEDFTQIIQIVKDHETILRGPDRNDGLITQMLKLNDRIEQAEKKMDTFAATMKAITIPLALTLSGAILTFVWGLLTHAITLTVGH